MFVNNHFGKSSNLSIILFGILYLVADAFLISREFYWLAILPAILTLLIWFVYAPDKILIFISFFTPLSINISEFGSPIGLSLPTEPLLALLLIFFIFLIVKGNIKYPKLALHPLSIAFIFYFSWYIITTLTSSDIIVSAKSLLAKFWLIIPILFFGAFVFRKRKNIDQFIWAQVAGFIIVIIYTTVHHAMFSFTSESAHWVMSPFYNDHTSYGAMLALFIPIITGYLFMSNITSTQKFLIVVVLIIFIIAIILSVSRAAWASVILAIGIAFLVRFKIKIKWLVMLGFVALALFFSFRSEIMMKLEKNKQDAKGGLVEHVKSVSNVATDASNLERINRWMCAIRMFDDKPFFGYGPGTYQFVYAPFQYSNEKTVISTNVGNRGTAHSEYLLALSEQGIPGVLAILAIFAIILIYAVRNYLRIKNPNLKVLLLALIMGMTTYLAHGFFNNFLDTDKAAVPFWGIAAIILSIDLFYERDETSST